MVSDTNIEILYLYLIKLYKLVYIFYIINILHAHACTRDTIRPIKDSILRCLILKMIDCTRNYIASDLNYVSDALNSVLSIIYLKI